MIETLFQKTEEYTKTSFEILKLKTIKKSSEVASSILSSFILIIVILIFLVTLSFGSCFLLGKALNSVYYGFMIVAAFWAVIGIVYYFFFSKKIKKLIKDSIIKNTLDNYE
jgi:hypothetical protein